MTLLPHRTRGARARWAASFLGAVLAAGWASAETVVQGPFRVEYAVEDEALALDTAATLEEAAQALAARLPVGDKPIHVVICRTLREFLQYAGPYAQPSVGGISEPRRGFIAIKAPRLLMEGDYYGTLRHELIHVLLARNLNDQHLPRWLNEGVTMMLSGEHRWNSMFHVAQMYMQGQTIPYRDFDAAFLSPGQEMKFGNAYAQALSMTRFLMNRLGEDAFWEMLRRLDVMTFDQAIGAALGITPDDLYETWRHSLWKVALVSSIVSGFTLFQFMALLTLVAYARKRRRARQLLRQWTEQEEDDRLILSVFDLEGRESESPWEEEDEER